MQSKQVIVRNTDRESEWILKETDGRFDGGIQWLNSETKDTHKHIDRQVRRAKIIKLYFLYYTMSVSNEYSTVHENIAINTLPNWWTVDLFLPVSRSLYFFLCFT